MLMLVTVKKQFSISESLEELRTLTIEPLCIVEEVNKDELDKIYFNSPLNSAISFELNKCKTIEKIYLENEISINWEEQWELHAPGYQNNSLVIDLKEFGEQGIIQLKAGAGFGDLSHPTTHLMLQMMAQQLRDRAIIDIGSGSGILSIAALKMGASSVLGIDIDQAAIEHSRCNAIENGLPIEKCAFRHASEMVESRQMDKNQIALMNMIWSEQQQAYAAFPFKGEITEWITSGLLETEREAYLSACELFGWKLVRELHRDGWCAFHFICRTH